MGKRENSKPAVVYDEVGYIDKRLQDIAKPGSISLAESLKESLTVAAQMQAAPVEVSASKPVIAKSLLHPTGAKQSHTRASGKSRASPAQSETGIDVTPDRSADILREIGSLRRDVAATNVRIDAVANQLADISTQMMSNHALAMKESMSAARMIARADQGLMKILTGIGLLHSEISLQSVPQTTPAQESVLSSAVEDYETAVDSQLIVAQTVSSSDSVAESSESTTTGYAPIEEHLASTTASSWIDYAPVQD